MPFDALLKHLREQMYRHARFPERARPRVRDLVGLVVTSRQKSQQPEFL